MPFMPFNLIYKYDTQFDQFRVNLCYYVRWAPKEDTRAKTIGGNLVYKYIDKAG